MRRMIRKKRGGDLQGENNVKKEERGRLTG